MTDRYPASDYAKLVKATVGSRVRNVSPVIDPETGKRIASRHEMRVLTGQRARLRAGDIDVLASQVTFRIEGGTWTADAVVGRVVLIDGVPHLPLTEVLDAKGMLTDTYKRSRNQMRERYAINITEIKR